MEHNSLSLVFLLLLISLTSQSLQEPTTESSPISALVPALFVIGDSTVDCGTNNHLITFARANHPPYGCDFDTHSPTGRFSNGRIIVDFLGNVLSLIKITLFEHFFFYSWLLCMCICNNMQHFGWACHLCHRSWSIIGQLRVWFVVSTMLQLLLESSSPVALIWYIHMLTYSYNIFPFYVSLSNFKLIFVVWNLYTVGILPIQFHKINNTDYRYKNKNGKILRVSGKTYNHYAKEASCGQPRYLCLVVIQLFLYLYSLVS